MSLGACQRRRKKGPPRRRKKGPLGGCELVPVVHGRDLWAHGVKRGLGGRFTRRLGLDAGGFDRRHGDLYGTSENAVKTQIWIAVSVYVLVAIVKKRLDLDASLYTLLQILSVTLFEKMPIHQALAGDENRCNASQITNQLNLFDC